MTASLIAPLKLKILTVTANDALIQINGRGAKFQWCGKRHSEAAIIVALLGNSADKGQTDDDRPKDRQKHIGDDIDDCLAERMDAPPAPRGRT